MSGDHPSRGHVLVVEDDANVREVIAETLEGEGYDVISAANGLEALRCLRGALTPPCLILLDLMMPVMDGWQFRDEQKKDPSIALVPVVVLSAHGDLTTSIDATGYLSKPIKLDPLLKVIARFCGLPTRARSTT